MRRSKGMINQSNKSIKTFWSKDKDMKNHLNKIESGLLRKKNKFYKTNKMF